MHLGNLAENESFTKSSKQLNQSQYWIKVFLKKGTTMQDCFGLCKEFKTHPLIQEAYLFLDNMLDPKDILQQLRLAQLELEKKYRDTEEILKLLTQKKRSRSRNPS